MVDKRRMVSQEVLRCLERLQREPLCLDARVIPLAHIEFGALRERKSHEQATGKRERNQESKRFRFQSEGTSLFACQRR